MSLRIDPPITTVWLDVSLLLVCDPHQPTGIPRATAELFRAWWAAGYPNLRLCRLDMRHRAYLEIPPKLVLARFPLATSPLPLETPGDQPPTEIPKPPPSFKQRAFRFLHSGYHCLPAPLRWLIRQGFIAGCHGRDFLRRLRDRRFRAPLELGPTDLVLSLGGNWMVPGSSSLVANLRRKAGFRSVHLMYDLIPIKLPQFYPTWMFHKFHDWTLETLADVDLVVAISNHTRLDIQEFCASRGLPAPPVEVIRLGELLPPAVAPGMPTVPSVLSSQPFVLSVGTLEIRKNHLLLYHAWRRLVQRDGPGVPKLVLVGAPGWLSKEVLHQMQHDPLTRDHILIIPRCDDRQLRWLYQKCLFTLYPSHYEGWGLPIAESLSLGKYCVAANTSSMPEIGGDLVAMHDPCDLPACLRLITLALDPAFRAAREEAIRRSYRRTSWDETAQQFIHHIETHFGPTFQQARPNLPIARSA